MYICYVRSVIVYGFGRFLDKNISAFTFCGVSLDRFTHMISPVVEKIRSEGTDVACTVSLAFAAFRSIGNLFRLYATIPEGSHLGLVYYFSDTLPFHHSPW